MRGLGVEIQDYRVLVIGGGENGGGREVGGRTQVSSTLAMLGEVMVGLKMLAISGVLERGLRKDVGRAKTGSARRRVLVMIVGIYIVFVFVYFYNLAVVKMVVEGEDQCRGEKAVCYPSLLESVMVFKSNQAASGVVGGGDGGVVVEVGVVTSYEYHSSRVLFCFLLKIFVSRVDDIRVE